MIDLNLFGLEQRELNILQNAFIVNDQSILLVLEAYKFINHSKLISVLNSLIEDNVIISDYSFADIIYTNKFDDYSTNDADGFLVFRGEGNNLIVVLNGLMQIQENSLILSLSKYNLSFVRATPLQFKQLQNHDYVYPYNAHLLISRIILEAIRNKATDVHFDVKHREADAEYTVAYRVDTRLIPMDLFAITKSLNSDMIISLLEKDTNVTAIDLNSTYGVTALAQDIFGDGNVALRISANKVYGGYHYVLRIQEKKTFSLTLDRLGFDNSIQDDLKYILRKRNGITLITGAIRTGKNTTAFALANELVKKPIKLISYESPMEVLMPFTQVDYADNVNMLLEYIKLAKKQDINVAFLNEIPNKDVAFAIQDLANSAIHVITTMHMDRIWHLPYKLKEYFGDSFKDVLSQINGVFNQKMFAVACPHCQERILTAEILDDRKQALLTSRGVSSILASKGCELCNGTGELQGVNQPYMERLIFTEKLKRDLLRCEFPYQMENILYNSVHELHQDFEKNMVDAIQDGKLGLDALDYII